MDWLRGWVLVFWKSGEPLFNAIHEEGTKLEESVWWYRGEPNLEGKVRGEIKEKVEDGVDGGGGVEEPELETGVVILVECIGGWKASEEKKAWVKTE